MIDKNNKLFFEEIRFFLGRKEYFILFGTEKHIIWFEVRDSTKFDKQDYFLQKKKKLTFAGPVL